MTTKLIGAAPDTDIRIDHPRVSQQHARLTIEGGHYVLQDLGSTNGTFVDGERIASARISTTSEIRLGPVEVSFADILGKTDKGGPEETPEAPKPPTRVEAHVVGASMLTIGRDRRCDIVINDDAVSAHHARVMQNCGRLIIEDAGSVKGTWVNGKPVSWKILTAEDVVTIEGRSFRFAREETAPRDASGARVDLRAICTDVTDRETGNPLRIIDEVSFTALPGEIVGIMGASGSGKTTLLYSLAGLSRPTAGQVLIDGRVLDEKAAEQLGFAPQDDIVHGMLTVEEAVRYSARMRCPAHTTAEEIEKRVTQAIEDVGLEAKRTTRIGSVTSKSLSGGQRKRVSIAMELVADPPLLLLDEPTSGLSANDAADLLLLLRKLARRGRTILLTIHQPSYEVYVQMDQVAILDAGRLIYFGPTAIDSFDYVQATERTPDAVFRGLEDIPGDPDARAQRYRSSKLYARFVAGRAQTLESDAQRPSVTTVRDTPGGLAVLALLVRRGLLLKTRDQFFWIVAILVPLIASALICLVIGTQLNDVWDAVHVEVEHTYLLILTIMVCFFGSLSSSLEIVNERAIFSRERRGGVGVAPYITSKAIVYAIPAIVHPAISLAVFFALGNALEGSYSGYLVVLIPAFFAAACAGLCLSASIASAEGVIGLAVAYAIVQTVFSAFAPLHVATGEDARSPWLDAVSYPITARWTLSGLASQSDLCVDDPGGAAAPVETASAPVGDPAGDPTGDPTGDPAGVPSAAPPVPTFETTCSQGNYHRHGIAPSAKDSHHYMTSEERLDSDYRDAAIYGNGALALAALFGAGLLTARRKKQ